MGGGSHRPFSAGGSNDPDNLQTLCRDCHKAKTSEDRGGVIKKVLRQARKLGVDRSKRPPRKKRKILARGFDKRLTKKLSGEVVPSATHRARMK